MTSTTLNQTLSTINTFEDYEKLKASIEEELARAMIQKHDVYGLYRDWLPTSGEELGDLPCIFCYYNFDHEVAETELITECWLLLK